MKPISYSCLRSFGRYQSRPFVGKHLAELLVSGAGYAEGAGEGFEDGFDLVVVGAAIHGLDVDVGARAAGKALEEVCHQFGLQIADEARAHFCVHSEVRPAAQVNGRDGEGLVHGHDEIAGAQDATLVAERAVKGLAERDADVFNGVVLIDIKIAVAGRAEDRRRHGG